MTPIPVGLNRALSLDRLRRVPLGPLRMHAIGEILRSRLGAALPRFSLTRLYDTCGGSLSTCWNALTEKTTSSPGALGREPVEDSAPKVSDSRCTCVWASFAEEFVETITNTGGADLGSEFQGHRPGGLSGFQFPSGKVGTGQA